MKKKNLTKQKLLRLFYRASFYACHENQSEENIEKANSLVDELISLLPFQNEQEKDKYLDVVFGFKFWEDWEQETIRIINQLY